MSDRAYRCTKPGCERKAVWSITRIGDVVAAWACNGGHLVWVLKLLKIDRPDDQKFTVGGV